MTFELLVSSSKRPTKTSIYTTLAFISSISLSQQCWNFAASCSPCQIHDLDVSLHGIRTKMTTFLYADPGSNPALALTEGPKWFHRSFRLTTRYHPNLLQPLQRYFSHYRGRWTRWNPWEIHGYQSSWRRGSPKTPWLRVPGRPQWAFKSGHFRESLAHIPSKSNPKREKLLGFW